MTQLSEPQPRPAPVPKPIAWADGRVLPAAEATLPLVDDSVLRGDGVFETVLVRGGRTHALEAHLARMRGSAKALGIRLPVLRQVVADLLAAWGQHDGALRLVVTSGGTVRGALTSPSWPASIALVPLDLPWGGVFPGAKTLSYAPNSWATRQAKAAHGDDALVCTDGTVLEVPTAAVAWVRDGRVRSPDPAKLPILDSVTLRELTRVVDVEFGVYPLDDLLGADEAFVLSASRPVLPVHAVGDAEFPTPGPLTTEVRAAFDAHLEATLDPLP